MEKDTGKLDEVQNIRISYLETRFDKLETKVNSLEDKFDTKFEKLETKMDNGFVKIDEKFEKMFNLFESHRSEQVNLCNSRHSDVISFTLFKWIMGAVVASIAGAYSYIYILNDKITEFISVFKPLF